MSKLESGEESLEALLARFSPEQRRIFAGQALDRVEAMVMGQPWVREYLASPKQGWPLDAVVWVRTRPRVIQELLVRFPPGCLVKARPEQHLMVPAPGTYGLVVSYFESGDVSVVQSPTAGVRAQCEADWLEPAAYLDGQGPEDVRAVLGWDVA